MQIMITNGGPHPADKWAEVTTQSVLDLIEIADNSATPEAFAARKAKRDLQPVLFDLFMDGCDCAQQAERTAIEEAGHCRSNEAIDPCEHLDEIMTNFSAAMAGTPFAEHFAKPEVLDVVRRMVGKNVATAIHIERCCAADATTKGA